MIYLMIGVPLVLAVLAVLAWISKPGAPGTKENPMVWPYPDAPGTPRVLVSQDHLNQLCRERVSSAAHVAELRLELARTWRERDEARRGAAMAQEEIQGLRTTLADVLRQRDDALLEVEILAPLAEEAGR